MNLYDNKSECCGCDACVNICPTSIIRMETDTEGFNYPKIEELSKCIQCKQCEKVCPIKNIKTTNNFKEMTYAGYSLSDNEIKSSSSGGLATAIARSFIKNNGIVYGVRYSDDFEESLYWCANNEEDLEKFKTSKYAQSRKYSVYKNIYEKLKNGKKVLFIGLPCDAYALQLFCRNNKNLYLCTLICHGVTSPKVHHEYLRSIRTNTNYDIEKFSLRYKYHGWKPYYIYVSFKNGKNHIERFDQSVYGNAFLFLKRPSCNKCKIKREKIHSDITIGDYHYVSDGKQKPYNSNGVSCAFVHNEKGQFLLNSIENFYIEEVPLSNALHNSGYLSATPARKNRDEYGKVFAEKGLLDAANLNSCKKIEREIKRKKNIMRRLSKMKQIIYKILKIVHLTK